MFGIPSTRTGKQATIPGFKGCVCVLCCVKLFNIFSIVMIIIYAAIPYLMNADVFMLKSNRYIYFYTYKEESHIEQL